MTPEKKNSMKNSFLIIPASTDHSNKIASVENMLLELEINTIRRKRNLKIVHTKRN